MSEPSQPDYVLAGAPDVHITVSEGTAVISLKQFPDDPEEYEQEIVLTLESVPEFVRLLRLIHKKHREHLAAKRSNQG